MSISIDSSPDGRLIGRDRTGSVLSVISIDHLTAEQRSDLAAIYRGFSATIQPPREDTDR